MAYKRNLGFPLAPTFEDDKKKKKPTYGTGSKTVTKKSGATKTTAISDSGRKKTVTKTSKKGATTTRTKTISPDYKSITYTKKKDGKVVKNKTVKSQTQRERSMLETSGGDYSGVAKRQAKKAVKLTNKPADIKAKQEKREARKNKPVSGNKAKRKYKRQETVKKVKKAIKKAFTPSQQQIENRAERKKKGAGCSTKGTQKCASTKKRFKN
jgi:hypothetical protein